MVRKLYNENLPNRNKNVGIYSKQKMYSMLSGICTSQFFLNLHPISKKFSTRNFFSTMHSYFIKKSQIFGIFQKGSTGRNFAVYCIWKLIYTFIKPFIFLTSESFEKKLEKKNT